MRAALEYGALGLFHISHLDDQVVVGTCHESPNAAPGVAICRRDGDRLAERLASGETVDVASISRGAFAELVRDGVRDVEAAVRYLAGQGLATDRIVLVGASYGCSVALLSAGEVAGVRALVLLSPGTNYFGIDVTGAAASVPGPLLIVAAQDDRDAAANARTLAERHQAADDLEIYPSGGHGTQLFGPRPQLEQRIVEFAGKAVEPGASP